MKIKITADSTCDLPQNVIEKLGISIIPLTVIVGEKQYKDGVDITSKEIFSAVENEKKDCSTTAINTFEFIEFFKNMSDEFDAIIHISIGENFSSCYENASIAAKEFKNVYVMSSRSLSTGSGFLAYEAKQLADNGMNAENILIELDKMIGRIEGSFIVDKMDYLHRGGRCTAFQAQSASFIHIKPTIRVVEGYMKAGKKYIGNFEKCIRRYIKDNLSGKDNIDKSKVFLTHTASSTIAKNAAQVIKECFKFDEIIETFAGSTVSIHCGPNTLGFFFKYI